MSSISNTDGSDVKTEKESKKKLFFLYGNLNRLLVTPDFAGFNYNACFEKLKLNT